MLFSNNLSKNIFWLFIIAAGFLFIQLGATPIYILDEAKNAQCAREMMERNDWIVPTFNQELRTDKPVLHYYFMIVAYKIFGVNAFAARFFSAVLGLITLVCTYFFSKRFLNDRIAFAAVLVLVCSTQFLFEFRLSVPDPYLITFITLGLFLAFNWIATNNALSLYLSATSFAFATLAKGPVAIALPGIILLIWLIYQRKWKQIFSWHLLFALLLYLAIVLPWYIAVHNATDGAWTNGFFVEHNLNRFSDPQEGHGGLFLLTLLFVIIGLLPFSAFSALLYTQRKSVFNQAFVQFSAIVVLVFVVFFSLASTKLPNYPMPCYPFAAIILGVLIEQLFSNAKKVKKYPFYIILAILISIPIAGYCALQQEINLKGNESIALLLLLSPVVFIMLILLQRKFSLSSLVISYFIFNAIGLHIVYPAIYQHNPVAKTLPMLQGKKHLVAYNIYNAGFNFYLDVPIKKYYHIDSIKHYFIQYPDAILISRAAYKTQIDSLNLRTIASEHDLFELPTTILLSK